MATPPGTYVEVLYDYTYKSNTGEEITVVEGDKCLLLKKANTDWWSVVKSGQKKPIYVPANYVQELRRDSTPTQARKLKKQDSLQDDVFENGRDSAKDTGEGEATNNNTTKVVLDRQGPVESQEGGQDIPAPTEAQEGGKEQPKDAPKSVEEKPTDPVARPKSVVGVVARPKSAASLKRPKSVPPPPPEKPRGKTPPMPPEKPGKVAPTPPEKPKIQVHAGGKDDSQDKVSEAGSESVEEMSSTSSSMELLSELPEYANLSEIQQHINTQPSSDDKAPMYMNVLEMNMKGLPPLPIPPSDTATPVKECDGNWGVYVDEVSERQFYYNTETKESSWKPPRGLKIKDSAGSEDSGIGTSQKTAACNSFGTPVKLAITIQEEGAEGCDSNEALLERVAKETASRLSPRPGGGSPRSPRFKKSDKRLSMPVSPSLPIGWCEEVTESGDVHYKNEVTSEKWFSSVDDTGRTYFYREDSSESAWVLPDTKQITHRRHGSLDSGVPQETGHVKHRMTYGQHSLRDNRTSLPPPQSPRILHHTSPKHSQNTVESNGEGKAPPSPRLIPARLPSIPDLLEAVPECPPVDTGLPDLGCSQSGVTDLGPRSSEHMGAETNTERIRELRGCLNRAKVMENGKKVKKNWSSCFVVTTGPMLFVYKDQKASTPKPSLPHGKFELSMDLQGATVKFGSQEKTSRKNVFHVMTTGGTEYLFQHEDSQKCHEWYITLRQNISLLGENAEMSSSQGSLGSLDEPKELDSSFHEDSIPSSPTLRKFKKQMPKKAGSLERNQAVDDPTLSQSEKNVRIRDRLRLFFTRRPDIEFLKQQGIIKDGVFGSTLARLCEKEKTNIPKFVTQCMAAIEKRGLNIDGLYRVSGNLAEIQKLRFMVDQNGVYDLDNPEIEVHVLCGALKLFFRELKEPLIPCDMFDKFLDAIQFKERQSRIKAFKELVKALPKPNRETAKELFLHLNKVLKEKVSNRMHSQNIAIVFGPTLMWPGTETPNMAVTLVQQNQIVECILLEYKSLF